MLTAMALWKRLDTAGHDTCRLFQSTHGWQLDGAAIFLCEGQPAHIAYQVVCDQSWVTQQGYVLGWVGEQTVEYRITRKAEGLWILNEQPVSGLEHCFDLDLGFTPATNLLQLRRLTLAEGQEADVSVAWLDVTNGRFDMLFQRYERRDVKNYWYEAPQFNYQAVLQVGSNGFIEHYPELWKEEH